MSGSQTYATEQSDQRADQSSSVSNGRDSESVAFTTAMRALFHPKRIAVVGATPRPGFANNIHGGIIRGGYEGEIIGVTPRHQEVLGAVCYPTIDAIPGG
ncbi:MAG TPA: CoA-binding protein, partial [Nitrolancea sp.]